MGGALTDYKLSWVRSTAGQTVAVLARIYQGDITTEDEMVALGEKPVPVTRYRRAGVLREVALAADVLAKTASLEDAKLLMGAELEKDVTRRPTDVQALTADDRVRLASVTAEASDGALG